MLLYIDINDICGLKCSTCPKGVRAFPNTSKKMSLDTFRQVVQKGRYDGAYQVGLFNWVEPFLIENLADYTLIVKQHGLRCEVASTLAVQKIPHLIECLRTVDMLWVTVSGLTQSVYEVNHVGGEVATVLRHLDEIHLARSEGRISTDVLVRFLKFDYNEHEVELFRQEAEKRGFRYEVLVASGHPIRMPASRSKEQEIAQALSQFTASSIYQRPGTVCPLIFEHIAVNADGDVYQCSAHGYHRALRIGSYLDLSREEILYRRYNHPYCNSCDWQRRVATDKEKDLLQEALQARVGRPPEVRTASMSLPMTGQKRNEHGHLLPKDGHGPW
jgi:MoaA/NifB/PqqE/SkfB family radical SAM enzyme